MTLQTRELCGYNNGSAKLTYSFEDANTPPTIEEVRLINNGEADTFNVTLHNRSNGAEVATFSHAAKSGADQVLDRPHIVQRFGDVRMVSMTGLHGTTGWAFPFFVSCWSD